MSRKEPEVIEPGVITDIFVTGILPLEDHGENVRVVGYVEQHWPAVGGELVRVVTVRLILPKAALKETRALFNEAVAAMSRGSH